MSFNPALLFSDAEVLVAVSWSMFRNIVGINSLLNAPGRWPSQRWPVSRLALNNMLFCPSLSYFPIQRALGWLLELALRVPSVFIKATTASWPSNLFVAKDNIAWCGGSSIFWSSSITFQHVCLVTDWVQALEYYFRRTIDKSVSLSSKYVRPSSWPSILSASWTERQPSSWDCHRQPPAHFVLLRLSEASDGNIPGCEPIDVTQCLASTETCGVDTHSYTITIVFSRSCA